MNQNISIKINDVAGKIFDIIDVGRWLYYKDEIVDNKTDAGLSIDSDVKSSINYILKNVELPHYKLDLLFKEFGIRNNANFISYYFTPMIWNFSSIDDFLNSVKTIDCTRFLSDMISFFDEKNTKCQLLDCSISSITEYLERSYIKDEIKYKILVIGADPQNLISSIYNLFCKLYERIIVVYNKFNNRIIEFRLAIEKPVINLSNDIFRILTTEYLEISPTDNEMVVAISFLNDSLIDTAFRKDNSLYAVLGIGYKKLLQMQLEKEKLTNIDFLAVSKALSDQIRLDILDMIADKGMYTSEIASNLSMPFPKALYHINILSRSNIIASHNEGKRIYYDINTDFFLYFSEYIKKKFVDRSLS